MKSKLIKNGNKSAEKTEKPINPDEIFNQILQLGEEVFNPKSNINEAEKLEKNRELNIEITRLSKIHKECLKKKKEINRNRKDAK